ncbi:Polyisoprenoid-binding protein [Helicobacter sp. NHP19-003]|uniref:Polyisoprenoid-binding protein n=1 Tax=Helicobacter gastrocanis TaxID=2849641 RepID=A0ABN6I055_9HELI|nr:YceI family protein [Helicobacter sp. NHP19-003]BCZ16986.1 Polyisoprenoid-binding protein [Helicobacter sp. NHP19-003]
MKKLAIGVFLAYGLMHAASLDTSKASMEFTAFKTAHKAGVKGTFDHVIYKFGKDTSTIAHILDKASATINADQLNLHDSTKTKNVKEAFFDLFKDKTLKVIFRNVVVGDKQGTILASVRMNGKSVKVPMSYKIENKELVATGVLDILEFGLQKEFAELAKKCSVQHEKLTWSQVEISFKAPVKE